MEVDWRRVKIEKTLNKNGQKLIIEYPCRWIYKIIGSDDGAIRRAVEKIVEGHDYTITPSNVSRTGRYHSLNLEMAVNDEGHRTGIYDKLKSHPAVKMVL